MSTISQSLSNCSHAHCMHICMLNHICRSAIIFNAYNLQYKLQTAMDKQLHTGSHMHAYSHLDSCIISTIKM